MPPSPRDMASLWDMLDSALATLQFIQGRRFEELLSDRMLRNAVERGLEVVGEAAGRVSADTRATFPDIPWKSVVGLRNVLAHEYDEIRYEILWRVCTEKLPTLVEQLEAAGVGKPPNDEGG